MGGRRTNSPCCQQHPPSLPLCRESSVREQRKCPASDIAAFPSMVPPTASSDCRRREMPAARARRLQPPAVRGHRRPRPWTHCSYRGSPGLSGTSDSLTETSTAQGAG